MASDSPDDDDIALLTPGDRAAFRREEAAKIALEVETGVISPDNLNQRTEEAHTAQVEGLRVQLAQFRRDYRDRVQLEATGATISTGHPSRVILGQVTATHRKLTAAEMSRARFREWRRTVDNIATLRTALDQTPRVPPLPWLTAFEALVAAQVEAGMATKGQLREIRQQIADLS